MKTLTVIFCIFVALLTAYLEYDLRVQIKASNEERKKNIKQKDKQSNK
jgi:hypothetical protein